VLFGLRQLVSYEAHMNTRATDGVAGRAGGSILARMASTQSRSKGPTFAEQFGERLRSIRENRGMTQQELADRLQMHRPTITKYETGAVFPEGQTLVALGKVLEVSMDELILGADTEAPDEVRDTRLRASIRELEQLRDRSLINVVVTVVRALVVQAQQSALLERMSPPRKR
jgi:transcriptional regulator with XRE-family HTH domain